MPTLCVLLMLMLSCSILMSQATPESKPESESESKSESESDVELVQLRVNVNCTDRDNVYEKKLHSNYWTLVNYIRADYNSLRCSTSVTYATHGDYRYLGNVVPLVVRWRAPISVALYAPGGDFEPTLLSVLWLQQCCPQRQLIRQWVNFHVYFDVNQTPRMVPSQRKLRRMRLKCSQTPPFAKKAATLLYRKHGQYFYPVNVGRNIAKEASLTHYVLASDIELYPTAGLARGFLKMLAANRHLLNSESRIIYPLNIFEVQSDAAIPANKSQLRSQLDAGQAVPFHSFYCPERNIAPHFMDWIRDANATNATNAVRVFDVSRLDGLWDPVYIGTTHEPPYDERLNWEGMYDKVTHSYALCLLGYQLHTLDNAFLVHKAGIKTGGNDGRRNMLANKTYRIIRDSISLEYVFKYGFQYGCKF